MTITKLKLRNFQRHERLDLPLIPSVITITGPTDAGKSSIIRALRWLCTNRPAGGRFIHHGKGKASVLLEVDGHAIKRSKGNGTNCYSLDGKTYKAFGGNVPESVAKLLNVGPANFAGQLDSHWWFSDTPGTVGKKLNEIVNLELMDRSLQRIAQRIRGIDVRKAVCRERLKTARKEREELAWAVDFDADLRVLEELQARIDANRAERSQIDDLLRDAVRCQKERDRASNASVELARLLPIGKKLMELGKRAAGLQDLLADIRREQRIGDSLAGELRQVQARLGKVKTCPLCNQLWKSK